MIQEKILIVEDNKALSKLIVKKMQNALPFEVISAYTYQEAQKIVEENDDFFLALLDLNLPDAPNGEVVDMIREYGIASIVLTGSLEPSVRESILKKEVIDYVYKGNIDDVNYIFAQIERLHKNRGIKILVVDDSITQRSQIKEMLKQQMFTVMVAAHGEEALAFLEQHPEIKLVLTDFNMPVINGLELTKEIRKTKSKNDLSIIAMTASEKESISAQFLKMGANDFIHKPFSKEELACRVNNSLDVIEYIGKISHMAHNDFLTGVSNRRHFFEHFNRYLLRTPQEPFALAMVDIDNFKQINDRYGHDIGDRVILLVATLMKENIKGGDLIARFGGEEFCIVLKNVTPKGALKLFIEIRNQIEKTPIQLPNHMTFHTSVSIGVSFSSEHLKAEVIIKEADQALYKAKHNGKNCVEVFQNDD